MPPSRIAALLATLAPLCAAASGCGGKLAPLGDAGAGDDGGSPIDAGGVDVVVPDGGVVVTRVVPSSGPNSGGTQVTVYGGGFVPDGGTQLTVAGFAFSDVVCASDTQCVAVTPYPGYSRSDQVFDVIATIHGVLGNVGAASSAPVPVDRFTYLAGPSCTATLTCEGPFFPYLVVTCATSVTFYMNALTPEQQLAATGTAYSAQTNSITGLVAACDGSPQLGSCTTFSLYVADWAYCGAPDFCKICAWRGGTCTPGPNPTCTF
jgi:hypothetical protein